MMILGTDVNNKLITIRLVVGIVIVAQCMHVRHISFTRQVTAPRVPSHSLVYTALCLVMVRSSGPVHTVMTRWENGVYGNAIMLRHWNEIHRTVFTGPLQYT